MAKFGNLFNLLSVGVDAKTVKGEKYGYLTGILYLAPSDQSGVINVCPHASEGCRAACLYTAGMGRFPNVQAARTARTVLFKNNRADFISKIKADIMLLQALAKSKGQKCCVRLNGTSDLPFHMFGIMEEYPQVQFYDYTKDFGKMFRFIRGEMPANYHLTFSRSESNQDKVNEVLEYGGNVAVVFNRKNEFPATWQGFKVVSGDDSDLRFLDPRNVVVGLKSKGKAKYDETGFVVS